MNKDFLSIEEYDADSKKRIEVGISYGYIDRVAGVFDFQKSLPRNITGYKLSLDIENADSTTLYELEKIIQTQNKFINAVISLDGIISRGKARIAQIFSFDGISYDVEIIN